jgi:hypothetical protein
MPALKYGAVMGLRHNARGAKILLFLSPIRRYDPAGNNNEITG